MSFGARYDTSNLQQALNLKSKRHVEGFCTIIAPRKVILVVEKVQLCFMNSCSTQSYISS